MSMAKNKSEKQCKFSSNQKTSWHTLLAFVESLNFALKQAAQVKLGDTTDNNKKKFLLDFVPANSML